MSILIFMLPSILITYWITPFVIQFALKHQLVDNPNLRSHPAHTHIGTIPRAGGLAIFVGIFLPAFLFLPKTPVLVGIAISATILTLVGLWDDRKDRSPYARFILTFIAGLIVVLSGVTIPYITNPMGGVIVLDQWKIVLPFFPYSVLIIADAIALIWIVWTTNIIGWSGGIDGQLPGFVGISAIVIGILSLRFSLQDPTQIPTTILCFLTAGAFFGFLPWNIFPQKIMPGYGGKTLAGFMLAVLSILSVSKLGTALLVLGIPMADAVFMLIKRILSGHSPVWATSGHLHHQLLRIGWTKRKIAYFYWGISAIGGAIALILDSRFKLFAVLVIACLIFGFILGVNGVKTEFTRMKRKN